MDNNVLFIEALYLDHDTGDEERQQDHERCYRTERVWCGRQHEAQTESTDVKLSTDEKLAF